MTWFLLSGFALLSPSRRHARRNRVHVASWVEDRARR